MEVMEIVDRVTGHVSVYPAYGDDQFHGMQTQIDWQRRFRPDYRYYYRLRYQIGLNDAVATAVSLPLPITATATAYSS